MILAKEVRARLEQAADPDKAPQMQAYMKSEMSYLGVAAPIRKRQVRETVKQHWPVARGDWIRAMEDLWRNANYREERYAAIDLANHARFKRYQDLSLLPLYKEMIVNGAWWDYVDVLAAHRVGHLLRHEPEAMTRTLDRWSVHADLWLRRSAILAQLKFKQDTDVNLLKRWIEPSIDDSDFFARKAIGWALREYAKTDSQWVITYVESNAQRLNPLSIREALRRVKSKSAIQNTLNGSRRSGMR